MKIYMGVIAAGLLTATAAAAQTDPDFADSPRWYGAFGVGFHSPDAVNSQSTGDAPDGRPYDWQWKTQFGAAMAGSIGYRATPHIRVELQTGYYNSALSSAHTPGGESGGVSIARPGEPYGLCSTASVAPACISPGHSGGNWTWMWTGMANVIYDIRPDRRIDPFIGVGAGVAHVEWPNTWAFSNVPGTISATNPSSQTLKDAGTLARAGQFAVQALGGVSYRLSAKLRLDATYYDYLTPERLRWNPLNNTPGLPRGDGLQPGDFLGRFQDQSLIVGLRYAF